MTHRSILITLMAVVLGACNSGNPATTTTSAPPTSATSGTTASTTPSATTTTSVAPTTTAAGRVIELVVRDGDVEGGVRRERVAANEMVVVRVTSDVADTVHVHGYDLFTPVEAGGRAEITFAAAIPGVFEVELESLHLHLVTLEVR